MSFSAPVTSTRLATLALVLAIGACKPTAGGGVVDRKAQVAADQSRKGITQRRAASAARMFAPSAVAERGPRVIESDRPFVNRPGYLLRGTDLLLFLPCENHQDYFLVAPPPVLARVRQFYRFATRRPYIPVYMELKSRLIDDTITVASTTYTRIADTREFNGELLGPPKCTRPTAGEIMDRLRKYEPDLQ
ncbi:MAG: hypothetical protein ABIT38_10860 [Gemmatimonadaceae bacterium]